MKTNISIMVIYLLVCVYACTTNKNDKEKSLSKGKPNIIFILADDMGFGDLSCYGQDTLRTPNIDQMAKEGIRFNNHFTGSTVCAPSRASFLTGLHTGHVSVRGNGPHQLLTENTTIAKLLRRQGYKTGIIGKWGVGHPPAPDDPKRNGFDYAYGYINMWHAHNFYPEFLYRNGVKEMITGNVLARKQDGSRKWSANLPEGAGVALQKNQHTHQLFEMDALKFIEDNKNEPFFLYLALNMPHANNEHPTNGMEVPDYGQFADRNWPEPEKGFAMMLQMVDSAVGKVNQKLVELGIDDNSLVVFCSDNGPHQEGFHTMEYFNSNGELRGMKRDFYDGGVRTPFIAKWPNKITPNSTTDHVSAFWDILPTVAAISGAPTPQKIDGISFLPTLLGQKEQQKKHEYLYWEFYEEGGKQAVLKDNFKAVKLDVRIGKEKPIQLFNLSNDPSEQIDVASQYPDIVKEMAQIMNEAHQPLDFMSLFNAN